MRREDMHGVCGQAHVRCGSADGSVSLFRNIGSARNARLAAAEELVPPGEQASGAEAPEEARRGSRSKICVADWNGDGKLDLFVGDYAHQKPDHPEATPEERAEHERIRKQLVPVRKRYAELIQRLYGDARPRTKEDQNKLGEELREIGTQMTALRSKLPREYESHGWVWLFLRK